MSLRLRLQHLEQLASVSGFTGDGPIVEVWLPDNNRGGPPPGRHLCVGSRSVLVVYDPAETVPPVAEALP